MNNQLKQLIDKETFVNFLKSEITNWNGCYDMYTSVRVDTLQWVIDRIENNNEQVGLIDTPPVPTIKPGDKVWIIDAMDASFFGKEAIVERISKSVPFRARLKGIIGDWPLSSLEVVE